MKQGAFDYLIKPFSKDDVLRTVQQALTVRTLLVEDLLLQRQMCDDFSSVNVIGRVRPGAGSVRSCSKWRRHVRRC